MTQPAQPAEDRPTAAEVAGEKPDGAHPLGLLPGRRGGLTAAEVAERVARGDVNDVPVRSSRSTKEIVRANVFTRFNAIIGVMFAIILVVGPIQDGLFGLVIVANTAIGIIQELRAKKTLDSLALIGEARPQVRRDGTVQQIAVGEIVLDDTVLLGIGDKVIVDGEVTEADGLEIDESLLTGEPDSVLKQPGDQVMSGSFVVAGAGTFTATKVGREAYAAQLAEEASRFTLVKSELRSGIDSILRFITWLLIPTAVGLIISQLAVEGRDWREAVRRMIAGIVPMVPEGLVLLTSVAFAIGVIRLGRKQCLVQELPAIEGLARVNTVCLDKTGTLTEGGMDLVDLQILDADADDGDAGTTDERGALDDRGTLKKTVEQALAVMAGADARPNASMQAVIDAYGDGRDATGRDAAVHGPQAPDAHHPDGRHPDGGHLNGDGPESGRGAPGARGGWRVIEAMPFSSARKWSGVQLLEPRGGEASWLLGAPDVLLPAGHPALAEVDELGAQGLRVLLLGRTPVPLDAPDPAAGLRPLALVVLQQRLREDAADTLRYFESQQVEAKVISGDAAVSVGAVAAHLGLPGADHPVDARTLPGEPEALADLAERTTVFGRVTPQQKRELVGALQSRGHTVAMTGDGVNDVLALKDADIGVAMGSGSDATKAVAQIVLLNNSFAVMPSVVAEGRRVIGNIERVAGLFLVKTVYSVLLALLVIFTHSPYPFLPRHSTVLSTLTIGVPAFFLALAPNNERARTGFVRRVLRLAIPGGIIAGTATFTAYALARANHATDLESDTSVATLTLFLVAIWVLAIVARPYNWWRVLLIATMCGCFALVMTVPWLSDFFQLSLSGTRDPWIGVAIAVTAGLVLEVVWRIMRRRLDD
ncbi:HAD-IC family P-type ATPase [Streptomyces sp. NRRL S-495]|uniref:HAD-IC family P-type ATPase n=1 Tax=Streptomyces sp. NRRL S-495 TaxID=1609133 RepID=UPI0005F92F92|nr:HAD-IC family P-type ATPase [Streptomyces sp. NRRL S-495]KJY40198.1 metal ABC transporter ATPase [Streptomyces sp. NRRL S-495]